MANNHRIMEMIASGQPCSSCEADYISFGDALISYNVDSAERFDGYLATLPILRRLDGLVLMSVLVDQPSVDRLLSHGLQTVIIETSHPELCGVEIDNQRGGELAAEYLISKGHTRMAFVGGDVEIPNCTLRTSDLRLKGFRAGLASQGIMLPEEYVKRCEYDLESAREQSSSLFEMDDPPTVVFAASDTLALGVSRAAREHGLEF